MRVQISYPLNRLTPLYPGTPEIRYQSLRSIENGDSANTTAIIVPAHAGSHVDFPRHFCPDIPDRSVSFFNKLDLFPSYCLNCNADGNFIRAGDIESVVNECPDARAILLRTGMFRYRATDPHKYSTEHPAIHPEVPEFLIKSCPYLRLFGTDTISISSPHHRPEGHDCHRTFLCRKNPILLVEDLDLSDPVLVSEPFHLEIYPWLTDTSDGVPVIAFAEWNAPPDPTEIKPEKRL